MKKKFAPLNVVFEYEGVKLMAVPTRYNDAVCARCYFSDWAIEKRGRPHINCCNHPLACTPTLRKDKRHVVFVEVQELVAE